MASSSSSCLGRASVPVKRVWRGLSARLGRRRRRRATGGKLMSTYVPVAHHHPEDEDEDVLAGLGRLRREVRTCEYRDVHVMWEMLSNGGDVSGRCESRADDMADVAAAVAGKKGAASPATRRGRRKGTSKPAPWSQLVAYCGGAF